MSRSEFVTAVNSRLHADGVLDADVDYDYVVKLEAGKHRWPRDERRRSAIRAVLRVRNDAEVGFHRERRSRADEEAPASVIVDLSPSTGLREVSTEVGQSLEWPPGVWMRMLDGLTATAYMHGHAGLYPVAVEQVRRLGSASQPDPLPHPDLAVADARWSEFISWLCDNDGLDDAGQWLSRAYSRAVEARDPYLRAYVLMRQSQRAIDDGDALVAIRLARRALDGAPLPPKIHALCLTRLAEALALTGDDASLDLGVTADQRARVQSDDPADSIAQHCDHRYLTAARARCAYLLGDHDSSAAMLNEVLSEESPAAPLDTGIWLTYLAESYQGQNPERAADTCSNALAVARRCGSARVVRALLPLAVTLRQHRGLDPVDRFLLAHQDALATKLAGLKA
jgi:tetratricopeptide (TPR) repeat protein